MTLMTQIVWDGERLSSLLTEIEGAGLHTCQPSSLNMQDKQIKICRILTEVAGYINPYYHNNSMLKDTIIPCQKTQ